MTDNTPFVNTTAPLQNVALFAELVDRAMNRAAHLPGLAIFYGPSGFGKSVAAAYGANKSRAYLVQVKSVWTQKTLCQAICKEIGVVPERTIGAMLDQIGHQLSLSRRPLLIDEADFLVKKGLIEVVRDIFESSGAAIVLIGEELLPKKLEQFERVHGRVLDWLAALAASLGDARHLARLYCRGIEIADDLLELIHGQSRGSVRRICVNLDRVREAAQVCDHGPDSGPFGLAQWGDRKIFTGAAPEARRA